MKMWTVTKTNLAQVKQDMAAGDQAAEIQPGDLTWGIIYQPGNQRGQMTEYANGRGAVCFGGDSEWGDWDNDGVLTLDDVDDYGNVRYARNGDRI